MGTRVAHGRLMHRIVVLVAPLALMVIGCAPATELDKGIESDVPTNLDDLAADSLRSPIDHGALMLGTPVSETLTSTASFHSWTFALTADASVSLRTTVPAGSRELDTVIYLYRESSGSWGSYIARNDDVSGSELSGLSRGLAAGRYRVIVKGYSRAVTGPFGLASECSGAGCPSTPPPAAACLFGSTFADILAGSVRVALDDRITVIDGTIPSFLANQIVVAVQQSSHTDVRTAAEALSRVDGRVLRRLRVWEEASGRQYTVIEYGVGDNSYGAVFADNTTTVVAAINDGDLVSCTARPAACRLGTTFRELSDGVRFEVVSRLSITGATTLTTSQRSQVLSAVRVVSPTSRDVPSALLAVDGGVVHRLELRERSTGTRVVAVEFGAGGNSYGTVFSGNTTRVVARIEDGDLTGCTLLGAP